MCLASYIHLLYVGKGLPEAHSVLKHFKDAFDWIEANKSGRIVPAEGVDTEYDAACKSVSDIESNLKKHLKEQRKLLGDASVRICIQMAKFCAIFCELNFYAVIVISVKSFIYAYLQINYVTIGKDSYLLEVPESLCKSIPREYELQSSKKVQ